jgi:hypothetical protein
MLGLEGQRGVRLRLMVDTPGYRDLTARRTPDAGQPLVTIALGVIEGCQLIVVFRTEQGTPPCGTTCLAGSCPAGLR